MVRATGNVIEQENSLMEQSTVQEVYESYIKALSALMRELHQKSDPNRDPLFDFSV